MADAKDKQIVGDLREKDHIGNDPPPGTGAQPSDYFVIDRPGLGRSGPSRRRHSWFSR